MRLPIALLTGALLLTGCTATEDPTPVPTPSSSPVQTAGADALRSTGTPIAVGPLTLSVAPAPESPAVDEDGTTTVVGAEPIRIAGPAGSTAEALGDGSVLLRDAAGAAIAGIETVGADTDVAGDGLVTVAPSAGLPTATVTLAAVALRSATWTDLDDEGGRSLAVVPSTWARGGGLAVDALLWAQLVAAQPEADTQTVHDQLTCHQIGAPDKDSWNLEPWRPEVGLVQTMLARCNPE